MNQTHQTHQIDETDETDEKDDPDEKHGGINMSKTLKEMDKYELVNLERLAHLLKGLSPAELETLEILLDKEAATSISQSLKELDQGKGIPIEEW